MASKSLSTLLLVVGLLLAFLSALADPLGLGGAPGFGWRQAVGVAVGLALAAVGWRQRSASPTSK